MVEWLRAHLGTHEIIRLVSSLVLALLLWGWVTTLKDPERTVTFYNVQVAASTMPEGLTLVSALPNDATVKISGPRSVVGGLTQADVQASVVLDDVKGPNTYTVPVTLKAPKGIRSWSVDPAKVEIKVERTVTEQARLTVQKPDLSGDFRQIRDVLPSVSEVTISGAQSQVQSVAKVVLPIDIGSHSQDFGGQFTPVAEDKDGQAIPEVKITPSPVFALVRIQARGKSVAVLPQIVGDPADGYEIVDRTVNPPTVLIDSPNKAELNQIIAVNAAPLDVTGAKTTVGGHQAIVDLPPDVHVIDPQDGAVDVVVQIRQQAEPQPIPSQPVVVRNVPPGYSAVVNPSTVKVVLLASADTLSHLRAGDILVTVDASGLTPGQTATLTPRVTVPPNVQWTSTDPATIQVTLVRTSATATPEASPIPAAPAATPPP